MSRFAVRLYASVATDNNISRCRQLRYVSQRAAPSVFVSENHGVNQTRTPAATFEALRGRLFGLVLNFSNEVQSKLERPLFELVKIRASQINGCAYCIDMHTKDARLAGETEQRIYALNAWRETPFFSERERAALEWTEAVRLAVSFRAPAGTYQPRAMAVAAQR
jgi:AhpD family alkylhydroperoxidase